MMKTLLFSAAFLCATAALAQDMPEPTPPPGDGVTQQGTMPDGTATPPPGTNEPPMSVPAGTPVPDQNAALAPQPATTEYPACSRTVTDRCIQKYEKGRR
jgi:hypothetical protein